MRDPFFLEGVKACHVQCRVPGELTGPSAKYAYVLRHPRFRNEDMSGNWAEGDLQHYGMQADPMANYIMMSRPEKMLVVLLHDTPENQAGMPTSGPSRNWRQTTPFPFCASMVDFEAGCNDDRTWPTFERGPTWRECALAGDRTGDGLELWHQHGPTSSGFWWRA